jgi:signal transduction histidine kinase
MHYLSTSLFAFMPVIFLVYGLAFFMLGVTIAVEKLFSSQERRFVSLIISPWGALAVFAILRGLFAFMGVFSILYGGLVLPLNLIRLLLSPVSFYFLFKFGVSYGQRTAVRSSENEHEGGTHGRFENFGVLPNLLACAWLAFSLFLFIRDGLGQGLLTRLDILASYLIGFPGAIAASLALLEAAGSTNLRARKYLKTASLCFALYGLLLLIGLKTDFLLAYILNYETAYRLFHMPVQVFRTLFAVVITFSLLRFFRLSKDFVSIRLKAVLHVIMAVVIPAFCIILLVSYLMADALLGVSYKTNEKIAYLAAKKIQALLLDTEKSLKYNMLFARIDPTVTAKDFLIPLLGEETDINGVTFFDKDGEIFRAVRNRSSRSTEFSGDAHGQRMRAVLAALTPEAALTDFYMRRYDDANVLMVFPLSEGRIEVLLDLKRLYENTEALRTGKNWHVLLVDDKGGIVMRGSGGQPIKQTGFARHILNRDDFGETAEEDGRLYNAIEEKIDPIGWSLITEIPREDIVAPVFGVFKGLVAGILLVYLSAVAAAISSVRKVTAPINLIAERVKSIGRGDFASLVNIKTGDEIQTLSEEVEKMAKMLVEKKEMEKRLMQTQKIASLGRLVSVVAHEINNPLSVIIWSSQLLLREFKPGDRHHEDLKMLEKHALACKKIVDDLLRFSRTGKQVYIDVDINENIKEALSLIGKHTKGNISVILDLDPSSPKVKGDPDKLHQVFLNLAVNAVDAMKKDGGTLTVCTRRPGSGAERSVEVTFTDTGCGISPEDRERIFDPFFTTKEAGEGTGLGLSVSYGIVSDHGGEMWVESIEGKGATFHIVFPEFKQLVIGAVIAGKPASLQAGKPGYKEDGKP